MFKAIVGVLFIGCLFCLSAAGSWLLLHRDIVDPAAVADSKKAAHPQPIPAAAKPVAVPGGELPIPVRGREVSPEDVFQYSLALRNREKSLQAQQQSVEKQQLQLKLVREDIHGDQKQMEGMLTKVRDDISTAERLLATLQQQRQQFQQDQEANKGQIEQFKKVSAQQKTSSLENIKQMSEWVEGMSPEKAAEYLRELSNDGKMETAIHVLSNLDGRKASKILDAMSDPKLVVQLTERFKELDHPKAETKKR